MDENLSAAMEDFLRVCQDGEKQLRDNSASKALAALEADVEEKKKKLFQFMKDGVGHATNKGIEFGKTMNSATAGSTKYAHVVSEFGYGLQNLVGNIGGMTSLIGGGVIFALYKLVATTLEQNDLVLDNYDKLADFGAAGAFNADQLREMSLHAGYTVAKMQDVTGALGKVNTSLLYLGASSGEGMKRFFELAETTQETRNQFRLLGYSQAELIEAQADYVKLQTLMGSKRTKTIKQEQTASLRYAVELTELAALTGKSRKDLTDLQQKQLQDVAFSMAVQEANAKSSNQAGNRMLEAATYIEAISGSSELAEGVRQFLRNGMATSDAGQSLLRLTGGAISTWTRQFKRGDIDAIDLTRNIADSYRTLTATNGDVAQMSDEFRKFLNLTPETMQLMSRKLDMSREDVTKLVESAKTNAGDAQKARLAMDTTENALSLAFDNLIKLISGPINQGFTAMMNTFTSLITGISENSFFKQFVNSDIALTVFKDASDAFSEYRKSNEQIDALEKALAIPGNQIRRGVKERLTADLARARKRRDEAGKYLNQHAVTTVTPKQTVGANGKNAPVAEDMPTSQPSSTPSGIKTGAPGAEQLMQLIGTASKTDFSKESRVKIEDVFEFGDNTGSKDNFLKLDADLKSRMTNLAEIYFKSTGQKIKINSAFRTFEDQLRIAGDPKSAGAKYDIAKPGHSYHELGQAVDIDQDQANYLESSGILGKAGLKRPVKTDPVHIQKARNGGVFNGPMSGYPMEFHGLEAVVPLPNGHTIPVSIDLGQELMKAAQTEEQTASNLQSGANVETVIQEVANPSQPLLAMLSEQLAIVLEKLKDNTRIQQQLERHLGA